ncbi:hypothetical protein H6A60_04680 [Sutterella massiliensis]|uniref:peptidylprolyl isomerase n=1 Tax=Sutterella massiliensis TaxID=1816689 RepID=A0ABS2DRL4_9BURK|nr:hypothetical protein [Sutterella massiliensis]MBM6703782.1 hypothetical protein [Sutterella massiliensis]
MTQQHVQKNKLVTLAVKMADMTGKILEETGPEGITYLHGHGDIFPKIEAALEGRFPGEGFTIALEPEDAFGEYDADAIRMVPLERLGDPESVVPGLQFDEVPGEGPDGRIWRITDVAEGVAILEANHPLAGCGLQFEVKVMSVEDPSGDETGTDDVVVPGFLGLADKIVSEDDDDDLPYAVAAQEPDDSSMARLAKPPRIVR